MRYRDFLPEINRLSIVAAVIMLAFALTQLISFPAEDLSFLLFGILVEFKLDFNTIITAMTAILAAAGMEWLLQSHPHRKKLQYKWFAIRHWVVPVFTTLVIGVALKNFSGGPLWWVTFVLGSLLLMAVFIAEYNVLDLSSPFSPLAIVGLTALSFVLFLILTVSVNTTNLRLYLRVPLLGLGGLMVVSRTFYLRLGKWLPVWSLVVSLILVETAVGLNYLPVTSIQYGLALVGLGYALTSIVSGIKESRRSWTMWAEPVGMLAVLFLVGLFWR
ncbi:MAG: hypothetical protein H0S79_08750 [Anaerolineaceae bacterium]|jgi:hypothetical protein|nr:hypothetical protein [Anaerolineaceae bacterium]